jgi:hypothetical protein
MNLLFTIILILSNQTFGFETTVSSSNKSLGSIQSEKIKVRVFDSFSGQTQAHGQIVKTILSNVWVSSEFVSYNVEVSEADVMKTYSHNFLAQVSKDNNIPRHFTQEYLQISAFLESLEQAGKDKIQIVNYSVATLGDYFNEYEYNEIVRILEKYKMILVTASGNQGVYANRYPCAYPHKLIICVAAGKPSFVQLGVNGSLFKSKIDGYSGIILDNYSNLNPQVRFFSYGDFGSTSGTSFATPRVASALALIWSSGPYLTPFQVIEKLESFGPFVSTVEISKSLPSYNFSK